jgi:HAD superfamily hydrolase (TIGR01509 family)
MIKQFLFDCGAVLVELNFRQLVEEITGSKTVAEDFIRLLWSADSPWLRYDRGDLNTAQVREALLGYMPSQYHEATEAFVSRWLEALPPMAGMEELVGEIKEKGYPCYLLSNFSEGFRLMPERTPVLSKMDGMVISYEIHMLKPDPAIFHYTLDKFGIKAEQTLFIDDNLHNVEAARELGIVSYQFTTPERFRNYLQEQGIL